MAYLKKEEEEEEKKGRGRWRRQQWKRARQHTRAGPAQAWRAKCVVPWYGRRGGGGYTSTSVFSKQLHHVEPSSFWGDVLLKTSEDTLQRDPFV